MLVGIGMVRYRVSYLKAIVWLGGVVHINFANPISRSLAMVVATSFPL